MLDEAGRLINKYVMVVCPPSIGLGGLLSSVMLEGFEGCPVAPTKSQVDSKQSLLWTCVNTQRRMQL